MYRFFLSLRYLRSRPTNWIGVAGIEIAGARFFARDVEVGDRILLATDGLRECCYGNPERSVAISRSRLRTPASRV